MTPVITNILFHGGDAAEERGVTGELIPDSYGWKPVED